MTPSVSVTRKVAVDATLLTEEGSPVKMSILLFYVCTYRQIHCRHTSHTLVTQEVESYKERSYSNLIEMVGNPFGWWKQYGHFPTLFRLECRFLVISTTSCLVERLFSVVGQVDTDRRVSLSPDNMTLLVFLHETLPLVRKIRTSRIVRTVLEHQRWHRWHRTSRLDPSHTTNLSTHQIGNNEEQVYCTYTLSYLWF